MCVCVSLKFTLFTYEWFSLSFATNLLLPGEPNAARDGCSDRSFDWERRPERGGRHGQAGERGRDIGLVIP